MQHGDVIAATAYRPRSLIGRISAGVIALLAVPGCVYDSDEICGPHQVVYGDKALCVCEANAAMTAQGCVPCGANEVPGASGCDCAVGYARPNATAKCEPIPAGIGTACDATTACADPTYNFCEVGTGSSGYCTKQNCTASAECGGGYACDTRVTPSVCRRPPIGAGKICTSATDCAGTEATSCDPVQKICVVEGCSVAENNCFVGMKCCDFSAYGAPKPVCAPEGSC